MTISATKKQKQAAYITSSVALLTGFIMVRSFDPVIALIEILLVACATLQWSRLSQMKMLAGPEIAPVCTIRKQKYAALANSLAVLFTGIIMVRSFDPLIILVEILLVACATLQWSKHSQMKMRPDAQVSQTDLSHQKQAILANSFPACTTAVIMVRSFDPVIALIEILLIACAILQWNRYSQMKMLSSSPARAA